MERALFWYEKWYRSNTNLVIIHMNDLIDYFSIYKKNNPPLKLY